VFTFFSSTCSSKWARRDSRQQTELPKARRLGRRSDQLLGVAGVPAGRCWEHPAARTSSPHVPCGGGMGGVRRSRAWGVCAVAWGGLAVAGGAGCREEQARSPAREKTERHRATRGKGGRARVFPKKGRGGRGHKKKPATQLNKKKTQKTKKRNLTVLPQHHPPRTWHPHA
jgi:hypothetical protein